MAVRGAVSCSRAACDPAWSVSGAFGPYAWSAVTPPPVIPCRRLPGFSNSWTRCPTSPAHLSTFRHGSARQPRCCTPASGLRRARRWGVCSTRLPRSSASLGRRLSRDKRPSGSSILLRTQPARTSVRSRSTAAELDFRILLEDVIARRLAGERPANIARAAQVGIAHGVYGALIALAAENAVDTVVLSGGVFQNQLLLNELHSRCEGRLRVWTNHVVPPNDGGISLGQAALAALGTTTAS